MATFTEQHSALTGDDLHGLVWKSVVDTSARLALTITSADYGKVVHQTDNDSLWVIVATSPATFVETTASGVAAVTSVFGQIGDVTELDANFSASDIANDSGVTGVTVDLALNTLDAAVALKANTADLGTAAGLDVGTGPNQVVQLNGSSQLPAVDGSLLTGIVGGGSAITVQDDGTPLTTGLTLLNFAGAGVTVTEPVADQITITIAPGAAPVDSVFARTGAVVAALGDYSANLITNVASGNIAATNVQDAINELDSEKAALSHTQGFTTIDSVPTMTLLGRDGAGTGAAEALDETAIRALINVQDGAVAAGAAGDAYATSHEIDGTAHTAAEIVNTPAGTIAATDVQAAINELATEKAETAHTHNLSAILDSGTAASLNVGTAIGEVVQLENVGGSPGLPAVDGSQLTNVGGGGNPIEIQDEGIQLTTAATLINFVGTGVTVTEPIPDQVTVTIAAGAAPIDTVFGRTGTVVATLNDYAASLVDNDSGVASGTGTVATALDQLASDITTKTVDVVSNVAQDRLLGRLSVGSGNSEELTAAQVRTFLGVEAGATADQTAGEIEAIVSHDNLLGFVASEHIDWSIDQGATNIDVGNITSAAVTQHVGDLLHQSLNGAGLNTHAQIDTHITTAAAHIASTANPHSTSFGTLLDDTFAALNDRIVEADGTWRLRLTGVGAVAGRPASTIPDNLWFDPATGWSRYTGAAWEDYTPPGTTDHTALSGIGLNTHDQIDTHLASVTNPHSTSFGTLLDDTFVELNNRIVEADGTWRLRLIGVGGTRPASTAPDNLWFDPLGNGWSRYNGAAWEDYVPSGMGDMLGANNLSDVANAATARTNLGLAIGTNVQAYAAALDAVTGTNTGDQSFLTLTDVTEPDYTGHAGQAVIVKGTEDGVEFGTMPSGSHVIENSGTPVTVRANLNFTGGLEAVDDAVDTTDVKLIDVNGFSVLAKATTGAGTPSSVFVSDDSVLGRAGGSNILGGKVVNAQIQNATINALTKLATGTADKYLGYDGAGNPAELDAPSGVGQLKVRVATEAVADTDITIATALNVGDTVDGVVLADGDRVLVKNQDTTPTENGIWVAGAVPARANDFAVAATVAGDLITVKEGTAHADTFWLCTNNDGSDVVGTDALTFIQNALSGVADASQITTGTFANGRVSAGNVTQHEGSIDHDNLLNVDDTQTGDRHRIFLHNPSGSKPAANTVASGTYHMSTDTWVLEVSDAATWQSVTTPSGGALTDLSDVTLTTPATDSVLIKSAGDWIDGTINTNSITDDAVTLAKMAAGTEGTLISYDASGDPAAVPAGTTGHVLTQTASGVPTFQAAAGGGDPTVQTDVSTFLSFNQTTWTNVAGLAHSVSAVGTYLAIFLASVQNNTASVTADFRLYNSTQASAPFGVAQRINLPTASEARAVCFQGLITTVATNDLVVIQAQTSAGTLSLPSGGSQSFSLIKIA